MGKAHIAGRRYLNGLVWVSVGGWGCFPRLGFVQSTHITPTQLLGSQDFFGRLDGLESFMDLKYLLVCFQKSPNLRIDFKDSLI